MGHSRDGTIPRVHTSQVLRHQRRNPGVRHHQRRELHPPGVLDAGDSKQLQDAVRQGCPNRQQSGHWAREKGHHGARTRVRARAQNAVRRAVREEPGRRQEAQPPRPVTRGGVARGVEGGPIHTVYVRGAFFRYVYHRTETRVRNDKLETGVAKAMQLLGVKNNKENAYSHSTVSRCYLVSWQIGCCSHNARGDEETQCGY